MRGANDLMEPLVLRSDPEAVEPAESARPNAALPAADLAAARVVLGSRIVTVQQVRAVKDSLDGPLPLEI